MEIAKQIEQISIARETIKNIIKMTHNIIKSLAALALGAMLLTGCGKENKDNEALIGNRLPLA